MFQSVHYTIVTPRHAFLSKTLLITFLCHDKLYFLLMELDILHHLRLRNLSFHQELSSFLSTKPHLLGPFTIFFHKLKFVCFLRLCLM